MAQLFDVVVVERFGFEVSCLCVCVCIFEEDKVCDSNV
jgi:hypothetical protein